MLRGQLREYNKNKQFFCQLFLLKCVGMLFLIAHIMKSGIYGFASGMGRAAVWSHLIRAFEPYATEKKTTPSLAPQPTQLPFSI